MSITLRNPIRFSHGSGRGRGKLITVKFTQNLYVTKISSPGKKILPEPYPGRGPFLSLLWGSVGAGARGTLNRVQDFKKIDIKCYRQGRE